MNKSNYWKKAYPSGHDSVEFPEPRTRCPTNITKAAAIRSRLRQVLEVAIGYAHHAIQTAPFIRQVFRLPVCQTAGFMNLIARIMKASIAIPDFSSISKRSMALPTHVLSKAMEPGSFVIVDSTGLKVYGKMNGLREKILLPLGAPGANCIWPSMKCIVFWRANSPRRRWAIQQQGWICSAK